MFRCRDPGPGLPTPTPPPTLTATPTATPRPTPKANPPLPPERRACGPGTEHRSKERTPS
ncbi:hypothetical protein DDQ41_30365 [Streptomyces spongiicola]|uniref:Uncharacterized protein n=1 Tax=Streptomyces spongiicola TaxID=1690221 RepID=A0ABN5KSA1_9ACTN|nr:hypothetical protein DDQ41_30365 [Streptomyces spongiicola]